jgi:hypothetical protein
MWSPNNGTFDFHAVSGDMETAALMDKYASLYAGFSDCHKDPTNVFLHFITTPLGFVGFFSLLRSAIKSGTPGAFLGFIYCLSLIPRVSFGALIGTVILMSGILHSSRKLDLNKWQSIGIIVAAYILQDLAHIITGERTFQSTYSAGGQIDFDNLSFWSEEFSKHTYYLLPLCVDVMIPLFKLPESAAIVDLLGGNAPNELQMIYRSGLVLIFLSTWMVGGYCLDSKNGYCFFPGASCHTRVLNCNIVNDAENKEESCEADLKTVRDWAVKKMPTDKMSSHWWVSQLGEKEQRAFERCSKSAIINRMFRESFSERHYCIDTVDGMNEVYVTGPPRSDDNFNSDQIFYTKHVDGPLGLVPFCSVFRCIVGMDVNKVVSTKFPQAHFEMAACKGDVLAFDFNREVHYIQNDESKRPESDKTRVVLKLHYCTYPRILAPLGWFMTWANTSYNQSFRLLFLKTINPTTIVEHFMAWNVVVNTALFNSLETYVGQRNVVFLLFSAIMWWVTERYEFFLLPTSIMHYFRYISTYYWRTDVDFGSFKRDVLFFKTVSLTQLFVHYLFPSFAASLYYFGPASVAAAEAAPAFEVNWVSLLLIASGYLVSMKATKALGVDRTYFGAELGYVEPKWVTEFPYGVIPHPMITSQVCSLAGFLYASHFRAVYPVALLATHIGLYLTHMVQEHFDIHERREKITIHSKSKLA